MIIRCRTNLGADLGVFGHGLFYTPTTKWSQLRIGRRYRVYAMSLFRHVWTDGPRPEPGLTVMLAHEYESPPTVRTDWYPIELFDIEDGGLPAHWEFSVARFSQPETTSVLARWGYPELVRSDDHFEGLSERSPVALEAFRREFDQYKYEDLTNESS